MDVFAPVVISYDFFWMSQLPLYFLQFFFECPSKIKKNNKNQYWRLVLADKDKKTKKNKSGEVWGRKHVGTVDAGRSPHSHFIIIFCFFLFFLFLSAKPNLHDCFLLVFLILQASHHRRREMHVLFL